MSLAEEARWLQRGYYRRVEVALVLALGVHAAVFTLAPPYVARPYQLREPPLRLVSTVVAGTGVSDSPEPASAPATRAGVAFRAPGIVAEQLDVAPSAQAPQPVSGATRPGRGGAAGTGEGVEVSGVGGGYGDVAPPVFYAFDTPPRATRQVEPEYPTSAKIHGAEGTVILNANIDERGRIMRVWVVKSTAPEILIQAALDAIYQFEFSPGSEHGYPVKCTVAIPFDFRLNQHL